MDTPLIERLQSLVSYCRERMKLDQDDAGAGTMVIIDNHDVRTMEDAIEALRRAGADRAEDPTGGNDDR